MTCSELIEIANNWMHENGFASKGGVVCIYEGQVQGWVKMMPDPSDWQPGVYAVSNRDCFVAMGGDPVNGAKKWFPL